MTTNDQLNITQRKEWAKLVYLKENVTQQELAERVGVSRNTINKWCREWEGLKLNLLQTREERIASTLAQLNELDQSIAAKDEGKRFPTTSEADIRRKLTADLEALEQDASVRDIYNVSRDLLDWLKARDLDKAKEREHILEGLMIAIDFIDEVIAILRSSKNIPEGKERLIERFKDVDVSQTGLFSQTTYSLTEVQADAIVKMTLGALTGMEKSKVEDELNEKRELIREMEELLADRSKLEHLIGEELSVIKKKYGDERRTAIEPVSGEVDIEDLIPEEDCVVTFTNMGYIKRQPAEVYNIQKRGGRGVSGMKQRDEDFVDSMFIASSHENILFLTNKGNMFRLKCYQIPEGSKQSRGTNIVNILQLAEDEKVAAMMTTIDFADNKYFVCLTKNGLCKRTKLSEFKNIRKGGLRAITLVDGDEIAGGFLTEGDCTVMAATRNGAAIRFDENDIRVMGRTARGVRAIKFRGDDYIVGATKIFDDNATILTVTERGMGRRCAVSSYRLQRRGGMGLKNYPVSEEKGSVIGIRTLGPDDDVILISADGVIIRIRANDLRVMGRTASGVRVMRLGEHDRVATFSRTQHDDEEKTEEVEAVSEEEVEASLKEEAAEVIPDDEPLDDDDTEDGGENMSDNSEE